MGSTRLLCLLAVVWGSLVACVWGEVRLHLDDPLLTFNCAKLPVSCERLHSRYPLKQIAGGFRGAVDNTLGSYSFSLGRGDSVDVDVDPDYSEHPELDLQLGTHRLLSVGRW